MLSLYPSEDSERNHQHPSTSIVPISLWWLCWILHSDLKSCPLNLAPKKGASVWSCVWSRKTRCFSRCFPEFSRRRMWVTWWIFILYVHSAKPFFSHVGPGTNQVVTSEIFFLQLQHSMRTHTHTHPAFSGILMWNWHLSHLDLKTSFFSTEIPSNQEKLTVASRVR